MKQTAVEWLIKEFNLKSYEATIKFALEKEKKQIKDAYLKNHLQACWMNRTAEEYAEEYFNKTFKSE
mgnify:CR=1 FL=1